MSFMDLDVGIDAPEEQAKSQNGKPSAPTMFPLPVVMVAFLVGGYLLLREVWKS